MHVLAGSTALVALRAARFYEMAIALPEVAATPAKVRLPGHTTPPADGDDFSPVPDNHGPSLEDAKFDFDAVAAHQKIDLWRLGEIAPFSREHPLELAVFNRKQLIRRKKSAGRLLRRDLPVESIIKVDPTLAFVCPELIVLQMAARLDALDVARLVMELCGTYSPRPPHSWDEATMECHYDIEPVTSIERIRWYSKRVRSRGGTAQLRAGLELAMEGAASPAETSLALMMSLPEARGGYGFAKPMLNAQVVVPDAEVGNVGGRSYYLDAFWQDAYTDLEYESTSFHLDPLIAQSLVAARVQPEHADPVASRLRHEYISKADADRRRMRDLQYLGIHVVPVTSFDMGDVQRMDQVARALARNLATETKTDMTDWVDQLDERRYRDQRERLLRRLATDIPM